MTSAIFLLYSIAHLSLFAWAVALLLRYRQPATVPLLIVTFGLIYDNAVLAAGSLIGHGELLERLSVPRFFMHAFGTPLLMLSAVGLARQAGAKVAQGPWVPAAIALLTCAMIAVGVDADLVRLELFAKRSADLVSYGNAATHGPPVAPIVTIFVLIIAGALVWRRGGGPWLSLGSLVQFGAAALGDAVVIAGNLGELALLAGLIITAAQLSRQLTTRAGGGEKSRSGADRSYDPRHDL